jgi:hypothetical protein
MLASIANFILALMHKLPLNYLMQYQDPKHMLVLLFLQDYNRLDHYIIFHLSQYFLGGKIGGINLQGHFGGWSKFGNLGPKNHLKYSRAILRHQNDTFLWSKPYYGEIFYILHIDTFPMVQESPQSKFICESYASHKLTYHIDHHGASGCHVNPIT